MLELCAAQHCMSTGRVSSSPPPMQPPMQPPPLPAAASPVVQAAVSGSASLVVLETGVMENSQRFLLQHR